VGIRGNRDHRGKAATRRAVSFNETKKELPGDEGHVKSADRKGRKT